MDLKVLQFKNKKLAERLEQRQAVEDELRERIEKLEKRQATDDATLLLVNRYWGQVGAPKIPQKYPKNTLKNTPKIPQKYLKNIKKIPPKIHKNYPQKYPKNTPKIP